MKYEAQSIIIGRMKRKDKNDEFNPCFIAFFDMNDPHKTGTVPKNIIEYEDIKRVIIRKLDVDYLLAGNDLVINNLSELDIDKDENHHIIVTGTQN